MNFSPSEKQTQLKNNIEQIFSDGLDSDLSRLSGDDPRSAMSACLSELAAAGYFDPEMSRLDCVAAQETLAAISPSLMSAAGASFSVFGRFIAAFGPEALKSKILPRLERGEIIGAMALVEDNMSIGQPPKVRAVIAENGVKISGVKKHVPSGPIADYFAISVMIDDSLHIAVTPADAPGLTAGPRLETLGFDGLHTGSVTLDDCFVETADLIGPIEEKVINDIRALEDQVLVSAGLGVMTRSLKAALDYAKTHKNRGKPIIAYQEVGFKLAEMTAAVQTAQLLACRAAWKADTGASDASLVLKCAKVFCCESAEKVSGEAMQVMGAAGLIKGCPAEESYRDAKHLTICGTSSEISRMNIGDAVLKMY